MEISHLSASQINTYIRCPLQWYFRYVEDIKIPPAAAMVRGTATHKGAEVNYIQKIDTFKDLPTNDVVEQAVTEFEERQLEVDWDREEEKPAQIKDEVAIMAETYHIEIAPTVQPIAAEQFFEIEVADEKLIGYIDVMTATGIRDIKTTGRTPAADVAENNLQLATYAIAYRELIGVDPLTLALDYIVQQKRGTKTVVREVSPSEQMASIVIDTVAGVAKGIKNEVFFPNIDGWHCSEKWCGYWDLCRKVR